MKIHPKQCFLYLACLVLLVMLIGVVFEDVAMVKFFATGKAMDNQIVRNEANDNDNNSNNKNKRNDRYERVLSQVNGDIRMNDTLSEELVAKFGWTPVDCAKTGRGPIIMHNQEQDMVNWVCNHESEKKVTAVMLNVFRKYAGIATLLPGGDASLMLDIGANSGFYGLLAAKFGHAVVQFDLQPECVSMLLNSAIANNFQDRIRVISQGVNDVDGEINVPDEGCIGMFPAKARKDNTLETFHRLTPLHPLKYFIPDPRQEIMLMKVDTEGNEQRILSGAMDFFKRKQIRNAIVEFTPGFWKNAGITFSDVKETVQRIYDCGYVVISLDNWKVLHTFREFDLYTLGKGHPSQYDGWIVPVEDLDDMGVDSKTEYYNSLQLPGMEELEAEKEQKRAARQNRAKGNAKTQ